MINTILLTDSYKIGHHKIYEAKTSNIYSYFESRGGLFPETLFFGLQYILKKHFLTTITMEMIDEADNFFKLHFGSSTLFNRVGWEYIVTKLNGKLPLRIKAVPEGSCINTSNILISVENTDPNCYWLTNWVETVLSEIWYPITVSTLSNKVKSLILMYLNQTGDPLQIDYKLNDFGFRGSTSVESAGIGGCAHLLSFKGTDNVAGLLTARDYYGCEMAGNSIPASEHSTITMWGQDREAEAYLNMIKQYGDQPLYACVSDSYDIWRACETIWGDQLHDEVLEAKGTLVVRPDSGVPHTVVPKCLQILGSKFGYTFNNKGFKVLNPKIRLIQGDGVTYEEIHKILEVMRTELWSTDNISFGMGGGLLQKNIDRDTFNFAFKCSSAVVNGQQVDVFKCPITDRTKLSKKGRMSLVIRNGQYKTLPDSDRPDDCLREVYLNGDLLIDETLDTIRKRINL